MAAPMSCGSTKYVSSLKLLKTCLKTYEEDTMTKFIVLTKDKTFGQEEPTPGQKKIKWDLKHVPFDGVPFMVVGRKIYSCHHGYDKNRKGKYTTRKQEIDDPSDHAYESCRIIFQGTKKQDCPARIYAVHLIRFPGYKIPVDTARQKRESAKRLKLLLTTNSSAVTFEQQYVVCLPDLGEHRNHPVAKKVLSAVKNNKRQSPIDKVNLQVLVDDWRTRYDCHIKYRQSHQEDGRSSKLLFCLQTPWQRRLLMRYGQQMCLLDATYRTCRFSVPLYFLFVRTNVQYAVVGVFVTHSETATDIREALAVFQEWNPEWKPSHFMVDFCKTEISALEAEFPESNVLFCDFHRDQNWVKWTRQKKNSACGEDVLPLLIAIADSPTEEEFQRRLCQLQQSTEWLGNEKLRRWFSTQWLPQVKRWVQVFKGETLRVAIYTNDGVERLNESLKHEHLEGYKKCSLSELLTGIVTDFLPMTYQRYAHMNAMRYHQYTDQLPLFLKDKPQALVEHVLERHFQAMSYRQEHITKQLEGVFSVQSKTTEGVHLVQFGSPSTMPSCSCKDWQRNLLPCKHFCAVFRVIQGWGWERLADTYRDNPLFSLDEVPLSSSLPPGHPIYVPLLEPISPPEDGTYIPPVEPTTPPGDALPANAHPGNKVAKRQRCGTLLREISDLTYHLQDLPFLDSVITRLTDLLEDVRRHTRHEETAPLSYTPPSKKRRCNQPKKDRSTLSA